MDNVAGSITDPAVCTAPGNILQFQLQVTNTSAVTQTVGVVAILPPQLQGVTGGMILGNCAFSGVSGGGSCTISTTQVTFDNNGQLAPGQTLTINYQAQVADGTPQGTPLCVTSNFTFNGNPGGSTTFCGPSVNCPLVGPGTPPAAAIALSDQKPGECALLQPLHLEPGQSRRAEHADQSYEHRYRALHRGASVLCGWEHMHSGRFLPLPDAESDPELHGW